MIKNAAIYALAAVSIAAIAGITITEIHQTRSKGYELRGAGYTPNGTFVGVHESAHGVLEVTVCVETIAGVRSCEQADIHPVMREAM